MKLIIYIYRKICHVCLPLFLRSTFENKYIYLTKEENYQKATTSHSIKFYTNQPMYLMQMATVAQPRADHLLLHSGSLDWIS